MTTSDTTRLTSPRVAREKESSFSILDGGVLNGEIPLAKVRLVQAWIEIHREALMAD